ncbi:MAG: hypothetical protein AAFR11_14885 [Pseudomonadota bacterium]
MLDALRIAAAAGAALLGLGHLGLTAAIYDAPSLEALWFAGSGLAFFAVALGNLAEPGPSRAARIIRLAQNLTMVGFFTAARTLLPAPQVGVGLALFLVLSALSWRTTRTAHPA